MNTGKGLRGGKAVPGGEPGAQLDEQDAGMEEAGKCSEDQTGVLSMRRKVRGSQSEGRHVPVKNRHVLSRLKFCPGFPSYQ